MDWNLLAAAASAGSAILALMALLYSTRTYRDSRRISAYEGLDALYLQLLHAALDKPWLRDPSQIQTPKQKAAYEIYAYMVWCVVESVYDRICDEPALERIWRTAIDTEGRCHRAWFERPENARMFRAAFREYMHREFPLKPTREAADTGEPSLAVSSGSSGMQPHEGDEPPQVQTSAEHAVAADAAAPRR